MFEKIIFWYLVVSMTFSAIGYYVGDVVSISTMLMLLAYPIMTSLPFFLQKGNSFFAWVWKKQQLAFYLAIFVGASGVHRTHINSLLMTSTEYNWSFGMASALFIAGIFFLNILTKKYNEELANNAK